MEQSKVKSAIRGFLQAESGLNANTLHDEYDLFTNGVWDSLMIVSFVNFAEKTFGKRLNLATMVEANIKDIKSLSEYISGTPKPENAS